MLDLRLNDGVTRAKLRVPRPAIGTIHRCAFSTSLLCLSACAGTSKDAATDPLGGESAQDNHAERTADAGHDFSRPSADADSSAHGAAARPTGECITVSTEQSAHVPTVTLVEFSTTLEDVEDAWIDFGLSTEYGQRAPVRLERSNYRTPLLGMPPLSDGHFRVTATDGAVECVGDDTPFTTGPSHNGFLTPEVVEHAGAGEPQPGYLLAARHVGTDSGQVFILNREGQLVWSFESQVQDISGVRMSYDGHFIYAGNTNVRGTDGRIAKIAVDGGGEEVFGIPVAHHDFAPLENGDLALIGKADNDCDEILIRDEDGGFRTLFEVVDAYPPGAALGSLGDVCHTNSVHYHPQDDSFTFSDLANNAYIKVSASGELLWVLGGLYSDFTGDGAEWDRQHGHHLVDETHLVFFNNGSASTGEASRAIEVELDFDKMIARRIWTYQGPQQSSTFGDAQRLPGGNTLVTFSNAGILHEVNAEGDLVTEFNFPFGGATAYTQFRTSLYGAPPR